MAIFTIFCSSLDGLSSSNMNKRYGGGQIQMRNSEILDETYLGPFNHHDHKLKTGNIQSMQYLPGDNGPFYLNKKKREELIHNCETSEIEKKKFTRIV